MKTISAILIFTWLGPPAAAKHHRDPPAGPGNCYYAGNCTGSIKAQSVSANYCLAIGGNSWRSNSPKVCYKLEPLFLPHEDSAEAPH